MEGGAPIATLRLQEYMESCVPERNVPNPLKAGPWGTENDTISALAFSEDGRWLAAATDVGGVELWSVRERRSVSASRSMNLGRIRELAVRSDGRAVLACNDNGAPLVWTPRSACPTMPFTGVDASFSPDGRFVMAVQVGGGVDVWDASALTSAAATLRLPAGYKLFRAGPRLEVVAVGDGDGRVVLFDSRGARMAEWLSPDGEVIGLAVSPDGNAVAAMMQRWGEAGAVVRVWRRTGNLEWRPHTVLNGRGVIINAMAVRGDGRLVVGVGDEALIWDVRGNTP
jgi:WD40 repeat protein